VPYKFEKAKGWFLCINGKKFAKTVHHLSHRLDHPLSMSSGSKSLRDIKKQRTNEAGDFISTSGPSYSRMHASEIRQAESSEARGDVSKTVVPPEDVGKRPMTDDTSSDVEPRALTQNVHREIREEMKKMKETIAGSKEVLDRETNRLNNFFKHILPDCKRAVQDAQENFEEDSKEWHTAYDTVQQKMEQWEDFTPHMRQALEGFYNASKAEVDQGKQKMEKWNHMSKRIDSTEYANSKEYNAMREDHHKFEQYLEKEKQQVDHLDRIVKRYDKVEKKVNGLLEDIELIKMVLTITFLRSQYDNFKLLLIVSFSIKSRAKHVYLPVLRWSGMNKIKMSIARILM
jgi:hypothetical protein